MPPRTIGRVALLVALFFLLAVLHPPLILAQDTITNVISPIVSFQYAENFSNEVLTNGGLQSPIVSFQYQENFGTAALTNGGIISPLASYQYFEWPGNDVLRLQSSSLLSYYYQLSTTPTSAILYGRVTDSYGMPLSGVSVSAMVYLTPLAQSSTDVNGNYQLPMLSAGVYDLWVTIASYQTSIRVFTLGLSTTEQDFQLKLLPSAPATSQVNRQPTLSFTPGAQGAALDIFDGTQFVPITTGNTPSPNHMTIVLTHGWIPAYPLTDSPLFTDGGVNGWPVDFAKKLRMNGITTNIANIIAWDWRNAATGTIPPQVNTPGQGAALGTNLLAALGANYSQPVHFLGHSLGTMVNAAAINFLHGERVPSTFADVSATPWASDGEPLIHVTLFDEAELTSDIPANIQTFDGNTVSQALSPALLSADNNATLNWSPPLPLHFTWADNYVALVGFYHANAVNVLLQEGIPLNGYINAHSYPQQWYGQSILNPTDPKDPLGFQWSFENDQNNGLPLGNIPPVGLNDSYYQSSGSDLLALSPIQNGFGAPVISAFGNVAQVIVQSAVGAIECSGKVSATIQNTAQSVVQLVSQGFNYLNGVASKVGQTTVNIIDTAVLQLKLTTGISANPQDKNKAPQPSGSNNIPAMVWLPLQIPVAATGMAFDFVVSGDPIDDSLVCGIGTNNLFSLQAKFIPTNAVSTSRLIDVSSWAGTTNELFFGFMGSTSTDSTLQVQNIRFYSIGRPYLQVNATNDLLVITWPLWANTYSLEIADGLSQTNAWSAVTNCVTVVNSLYTVTNHVSAGNHFYRLHQVNPN